MTSAASGVAALKGAGDSAGGGAGAAAGGGAGAETAPPPPPPAGGAAVRSISGNDFAGPAIATNRLSMPIPLPIVIVVFAAPPASVTAAPGLAELSPAS